MFRTRLLVKTGCLRCRKRKKKCDEGKPACGYCSHWNLDCHWPSAPSNHLQPGGPCLAQNSPAIILPDQQKEREQSVGLGVFVLELFHGLPISDAKRRSGVAGYLHFFFTSMIEGALPFDVVSTRLDLAHGWAQSAFADAAVCYAFAAYCARLQSRSSLVDRQERHSHVYEGFALTTLRERLEVQLRPTEETILVAALHHTMLAFGDLDAEELTRVLAGVNAMVLAYGGYARMSQRMRLSTIWSIGICDMFCAFLNGSPPMCGRVKRPHPPLSLGDLCVTRFGNAELEDRCEASVMTIMEDLHFILYFRSPSRQKRDLTADESLYLYEMVRFTDNQLGFLQAQHVGSGTLTEVLIMAMVVLKREVIPLNAQHVSLTSAILHRHHTAIFTNLSTIAEQNELQRNVLIWACLVALVGFGLEHVRAEFRNMMIRVIQLKYGGEKWPSEWHVDLRRGLKSLLWHARLEEHFLLFCDGLRRDL